MVEYRQVQLDKLVFVRQYEACFVIPHHQSYRVKQSFFESMQHIIVHLPGLPSASGGGVAGVGVNKPGFGDKFRKQMLPID